MAQVCRLVTVALAVTSIACSGDVAEPARTTAPYTGPAEDLAPSQVSQPTVPEPAIVARCADADIGLAATPGQPPEADVVLVFTNTGTAECEIDLGTAWAIVHEVEPSVRLEPGGQAQLWGLASNPDCTDPAEVPHWELSVNGVPRTVVLPDGVGCGLEPAAFFPS